MRNFSSAQGRVTLKWMIQSGWNLNSSEILCRSWIPASLVKIRSKMTKKRWRHHFPHYKAIGVLVAMTTTVLIQPTPKPNAAFPPTPFMLHIKFDQDWPHGLWDIHVWKCKYLRIFWHSRACNSKVTHPIQPVRDFMAVLVTSKFDEDPIKHERASLETPFSHYKSMGNCTERRE